MTGTPSHTLGGMTAPRVIPLPEAGQWTWDDLQVGARFGVPHYWLVDPDELYRRAAAGGGWALPRR